MGELIAVVLHYVKDWRVHNLLIHVKHTDKSLDAKKLSKLLVGMLQERKYDPPSISFS